MFNLWQDFPRVNVFLRSSTLLTLENESFPTVLKISPISLSQGEIPERRTTQKGCAPDWCADPLWLLGCDGEVAIQGIPKTLPDVRESRKDPSCGSYISMLFFRHSALIVK